MLASSRLLVIHQEVLQRELLVKYGELVLMDATYRTTCYDLALFFLVVHTNTGYIVVAGKWLAMMESTILQVLFTIHGSSPLSMF